MRIMITVFVKQMDVYNNKIKDHKEQRVCAVVSNECVFVVEWIGVAVDGVVGGGGGGRGVIGGERRRVARGRGRCTVASPRFPLCHVFLRQERLATLSPEMRATLRRVWRALPCFRVQSADPMSRGAPPGAAIFSLLSPPGGAPPKPLVPALRGPGGGGRGPPKRCSVITEQSIEEEEEEQEEEEEEAGSAYRLVAPSQQRPASNVLRPLHSVKSSPQLLNQISEEGGDGGGSEGGARRGGRRGTGGRRPRDCSSSDTSDAEDGTCRAEATAAAGPRRRDSDHSSDTDGPGAGGGSAGGGAAGGGRRKGARGGRAAAAAARGETERGARDDRPRHHHNLSLAADLSALSGAAQRKAAAPPAPSPAPFQPRPTPVIHVRSRDFSALVDRFTPSSPAAAATRVRRRHRSNAKLLHLGGCNGFVSATTCRAAEVGGVRAGSCPPPSVGSSPCDVAWDPRPAAGRRLTGVVTADHWCGDRTLTGPLEVNRCSIPQAGRGPAEGKDMGGRRGTPRGNRGRGLGVGEYRRLSCLVSLLFYGINEKVARIRRDYHDLLSVTIR